MRSVENTNKIHDLKRILNYLPSTEEMQNITESRGHHYWIMRKHDGKYLVLKTNTRKVAFGEEYTTIGEANLAVAFALSL
jgi:hypothetical protein